MNAQILENALVSVIKNVTPHWRHTPSEMFKTSDLESHLLQRFGEPQTRQIISAVRRAGLREKLWEEGAEYVMARPLRICWNRAIESRREGKGAGL